jgi:hypothetical protein
MDDEERHEEEAKAQIEEALNILDVLGEREIIAGWVLCFEVVTPDGNKNAGYVYGPSGMAPWRAVGLLEWIKSMVIS